MKIKYLLNKDPRMSTFNKFIKSSFPEMLAEKEPDLLLVAGGDGAMLRAIQKHKHFGVSFFGKGLGTLNFLMNRFEEDEVILKRLLADEIELEKLTTRSMKVAVRVGEGKFSTIAEAVNDVVIGNNLMGYHEFEVNSADESFSSFRIKGTGLCLSTPLGSTAFNFNNNGTILPLESNLWSLTGIVCDRYLNDVLVEQELSMQMHSTKGKVQVFVDGLGSEVTLDEGVEIILSPGEKYEIAFLDKSAFLRRRIEIGHRYRKKD